MSAVLRSALPARGVRAAARPAARRMLIVRAEAPQAPEQPIVNQAVAAEEAAPAPVPVPVTPVGVLSSEDLNAVMGFSGAAPEIVNGRLAMLGFVAALGAELASGEGVARQWADEPIGIFAAFAVFIAASLIPLVASKGKTADAVGPFTPSAELLNGRAAMIGFAALLVIEGVKGSALF